MYWPKNFQFPEVIQDQMQDIPKNENKLYAAITNKSKLNDIPLKKNPNITDQSQDIKPTSTITKKKKRIRHKPFAFKLGDKVHISHLRSAFQYDAKWSGEIF